MHIGAYNRTAYHFSERHAPSYKFHNLTIFLLQDLRRAGARSHEYSNIY